jgi:metal-dependent amidase/aminoacylase/carboxypeptidase family protein
MLHQYPELIYQENITSHIIQTILRSVNVSYANGYGEICIRMFFPVPGGYAIVTDLGRKDPNQPCILWADIDALPIKERTEYMDNSFVLKHVNTMHACGHDAHTTMLLGAISILRIYQS